MLWWQGADAAATRTSPPAPRTRTARASSTSRSPPATPTATWCRSSPPRSRRVAERRRRSRTASRSRWQLKKSVTWHDGKPFTADDVRLHLGVRARPGHRRGHHRRLQGHRRSTRSTTHTVSVVVQEADAVLGRPPSSRPTGMIIPKHLFEPVRRRQVARGADQPQAGRHRPLQVRRLQAGRHRARRAQPELPHAEPARSSTRIEMKGGGDAASAARAVLQTGEYDYAWNLQVEDEVLKRMEAGRQGQGRTSSRAATSSSSSSTSPTRGPRSTASAPASRRKHSAFSDPAVRQAMALLVDRKSDAGVHLRPHRHRDRATSSTPRRASARRTRSGSSTSTRPTQILDAAGWKKGADGIRAKDGKKLKFVYQTSINAPRQKDAGDRQAGVRRRPASSSS